MRTFGLAVVMMLVLVVVEQRAEAGGCPTCTGPAQCAGGFCVLHSADVGCGAQRQICCPGQACNTFSGRPSCEGTTCTVVGGTPVVDASVADALVADSGKTVDSGAATGDGGSGDSESEGCGCRTGGRGRSPAVAWLLALVLVPLIFRRRR